LKGEKMKEIPPKVLLRPDEVARFWDVSTKTIYRWIDLGILNAVRKGGTIRIPRKDAEKLKSESG